MKVRLEPEALAEFDRALDYYLVRSTAAAEEFIEEIAGARLRLNEFPLSGAPLRKGLRRLVLPRFPYSMVYLVDGDSVRVFAIAHQKRRTGYWRQRVQR